MDPAFYSTNSHMAEVFFAHSYIRYNDIEACLKEFTLLKQNKEDRTLSLRAEVRVDDIDILLIGYLILFKEAIPELEIELHLPFNDSGDEQTGLLFKLNQFATYAYLMTDQLVFSFRAGDKKFAFNYKRAFSFPTGWFVLSESFMLLLLVTKRRPEWFKFLFENSLDELSPQPLAEGIKGVEWKAGNNLLYREYSNAITAGAAPQDTRSSIIDLGRLSFFRTLHDAKILPFFTDRDRQKDKSNRKEEMAAGRLSTKKVKGETLYESYQYYEAIEAIVEDVKKRPLCFQFIFSALVTRALLGDLTHSSREVFETQFRTLWAFTIELVHGIKELAKNIEEHASTHTGIITARFLSPDLLKTLGMVDTGGHSLYQQYLSELLGSNTPPSFLNFHILDIGEEGIIPTLIKSTSAKAASLEPHSRLRQLLEEDTAFLKSDSSGIKRLLDTGNTSLLNQQSKRAIAHFGLMTFSRLIHKNNGLLVVTSTTEQGSAQPAIFPQLDAGTYQALPVGTHYLLLLPVQKGKQYQSHLPQRLQLPADASGEDIESLETLFSFLNADVNTPEFEPKSKYIIALTLPVLVISNRKDEENLWYLIDQQMKKIQKKAPPASDILYHFDVEGLQINESQLFRFIGMWQTEYPKQSLIISNVTVETYRNILAINALYMTHYPALAYWNETSLILIYCCDQPADNDRFYFTDILWGKTEADFRAINRSIQHNHFNLTSALLTGSKKEELQVDLPSNPAFLNKGVLLPLDLILKDKNGRSFFELNALKLLQNRIQPKFIESWNQ